MSILHRTYKSIFKNEYLIAKVMDISLINYATMNLQIFFSKPDNMSSPTNNINLKKKGGIQKGQKATDEHAAKLDNQCKTTSTNIYKVLKQKYGDDITFQIKLNESQIPGGIGACAPDGGLWFWKNQLIVAYEAKKQQNRGNAIERWHKNHSMCRIINPNISYVTFACGEGAIVGGALHKGIAFQHLEGFDKYNPGKNSCWMKPSGFSDEEIEKVMMQVIEERITSLSK